MFDKDRLNHSFAVANKMVEIGKKCCLNKEELEDLCILGLNHDIGYEFCSNTIEHNIVWEEILKNNNYKYCKEVYYHGNPNTDYNSLYLKILNMADMQIDRYGNDVWYKNRLDDIKFRYGEESNQYKNARMVINKLVRL